MRNIIFLLSLLIIALSSCAPSSTATLMATVAASPTKKLTSTITPTLKPSVTRRSVASKTPSPTAEPFTMISKVSPNGKYVAYAYFYRNEEQTVEIKDKDGKLIWQIPFQGGSPKGYDPRETMGIYRWSNDSSHLYFCYYWSPDGGDIIIRNSCSRLQTIDINTGETQIVVPDGYTAFGISHDGSRIAYLQCTDQSCTIHIQNLSTGSEKTAPVITSPKDYVAIGNLSWSPNDKGLIFNTQATDYITMQVVYVNSSTLKVKTIKTFPGPIASGEWAINDGWVDDNTLIFLESGNSGMQVVHLNIKNNESRVIGTPTPGN